MLLSFRSHKRRFRAYISQNRSSLPAPSCLKLVDFLAHHKHAQPPVNLRLSKSSYSGVDTWKQRTLSLAPPTEPVQVRKMIVSSALISQITTHQPSRTGLMLKEHHAT